MDLKKILVLGASGETGSRIIRYLQFLNPCISITAGGRTKKQFEDGIKFVEVDVYNEDNSIKILKDFDLVISAIGPMELLKDTLHKIAIKAKVNLIDINDSGAALIDILKLHEEATKENVLLLSGMGLSPGITSLMLRNLTQRKLSLSGNYSSRMYMGSRYGGGKSSPYSMLSNFKKKTMALKDGKLQVIPTPWSSKTSNFTFEGHLKSIASIPYSSPEIPALASSRYDNVNYPIKNFDTRFAIQGFPPSLAKFISLINASGKKTEKLAKQFYQGGQKMKGTPKSDPDTIVTVYPDNEPQKGLVLMGDISSYDLTAAMCAAVASVYFNDNLKEKKGVYTVDLLSSESNKAIENELQRLGYVFKDANVEFKKNHDWFGWLESDISEPNKLRNFGKNWYTALQHPRMQSVQTQYLWDAKVWSSLKQNLSKLGLAKFITKMMFRWKNHEKQITKEFGNNNIVSRAKLIKDMAMFTSGYSMFRELVGQDKAFSEYREMFLETGGMEMHWLWPRPENINLMQDSYNAIREYYLAFLQGYQDDGVLKASIQEATVDKITFKITDCIYAQIFNFMGVSELQNLVREQEKQELFRITNGNHTAVDFDIFENGEALVSLTRVKA